MYRIRYYLNKRSGLQYEQLLCFNNNVSNLYNNSVVEKTNGMTFNPTTTLKLFY